MDSCEDLVMIISFTVLMNILYYWNYDYAVCKGCMSISAISITVITVEKDSNLQCISISNGQVISFFCNY